MYDDLNRFGAWGAFLNFFFDFFFISDMFNFTIQQSK